MLFDQCNEIRGSVASQFRLGKMRIRREKIFGLAVEVGEIAPATAGDENFFAQTVGVFDDGDAASALAGFDGAHQAGCAASENQCVEMMGHVGVNSLPQRLKPADFAMVMARLKSCPSRLVLLSALHVKQTEPWKAEFFQQALVNVLLLQLIDLGCGHLPAVGREIAVSFGANRDKFFIGS